MFLAYFAAARTSPRGSTAWPSPSGTASSPAESEIEAWVAVALSASGRTNYADVEEGDIFEGEAVDAEVVDDETPGD